MTSQTKAYKVTFVNHLDSDGNTFEFPTDSLDSNGATIETFEHVSSRIPKGKNYAEEVWRYEVDKSDAERFEDGLSRTSTALSWKRSR